MKKENKHLENLTNKVQESIDDLIEKELNISSLLLKAHLLTEIYLAEVLAVFDINSKYGLHQSSFSEKLTLLKDHVRDRKTELAKEIKQLVPALNALNQVRNNLAHNYSFDLKEADVNKIGNNLGSEFIYKKYEAGHLDIRLALGFCIEKIFDRMGFIIWCRIEEMKEYKTAENRKKQK